MTGQSTSAETYEFAAFENTTVGVEVTSVAGYGASASNDD